MWFCGFVSQLPAHPALQLSRLQGERPVAKMKLRWWGRDSDFRVWSPSSCFGSHAGSSRASEVRSSPHFFLPSHVGRVESELPGQFNQPGGDLKKLGGISGCVGSG